MFNTFSQVKTSMCSLLVCFVLLILLPQYFYKTFLKMFFTRAKTVTSTMSSYEHLNDAVALFLLSRNKPYHSQDKRYGFLFFVVLSLKLSHYQ